MYMNTKLSASSITPRWQPSSNVDKQAACVSTDILLIVIPHHAHPGLCSLSLWSSKQGFHVRRNNSSGHSADSATPVTYLSLEELLCSGISLHILFLHLLALKCENLYICLMASQRLQRDQCLTTSYPLYALRWNWWGIFCTLFWGRDMICLL